MLVPAPSAGTRNRPALSAARAAIWDAGPVTRAVHSPVVRIRFPDGTRPAATLSLLALAASCAAPPPPPEPRAAPPPSRATGPLAPGGAIADPRPAPAADAAGRASAGTGSSGSPEAPPARVRAAVLLASGAFDEAAAAADEACALDPDDVDALVLRGRAERLSGGALAAAGNGTAAGLRMLDAVKTLETASALRPRDRATLHEWALALRDAWEFERAADVLRRARAVEREDGLAPDPEIAYDLAHCLGYRERFDEALPLFREAEAALGPQARIVLNVATCLERLGDRPGAVRSLADHYAAEVAAGRADGDDARRALEKVWEVTVMRRDYAAGEEALRALADAHTDRSGPAYMLGNLRSFRGDAAGAAEAWARALAVADIPAARVKRVAALTAADDLPAAEVAALDCIERAADAEGAADAVTALAARLLRSRNAAGAEALLARARAAWPDATDALLLSGEAALARGDAAAALAFFLGAGEGSPFATSPPARAARAALALGRSGASPPEGPAIPATAGEPLDPAPPGEPLLDFDRPLVYVRAEGSRAAEPARVVRGEMRLPPTPAAPPSPADARGGRGWGPGGADTALRMDFLPDLDGTAHATLRFRARTESRAARLRVRILDGYDEMSSAAVRSRWPATGEGIAVGPEPVEVVVPLAEIAGFIEFRPLPPLLSRIRALLVAVEPGAEAASPAVLLDDLALHGPAGAKREPLPLADFEAPPAEVLLLYDGTCVPFVRTLSRPEDVDGFSPPGTTPVTPSILGPAFDGAMVGGGVGALRLHHGETLSVPPRPAGAPPVAPPPPPGTSASATLLLNPDRDVLRFRAITFLARGTAGGERVRVRIEDALDHERRAYLPAAAATPAVFPRNGGADGALTLERRWRRYRIPLDAYPDVDFAALAALVFEFGGDVGNPAGTILFVDDVGFER